MFDVKRVVRFSAFIVCSIGLIIQVNEISSNYFRYPTESKISITIHEKIDYPSSSACFRESDILQRDQIKKYLGFNLIKPVTDADWTMYQEQSENLTIEHYLKFSPRVDEVRDTSLSGILT